MQFVWLSRARPSRAVKSRLPTNLHPGRILACHVVTSATWDVPEAHEAATVRLAPLAGRLHWTTTPRLTPLGLAYRPNSQAGSLRHTGGTGDPTLVRHWGRLWLTMAAYGMRCDAHCRARFCWTKAVSSCLVLFPLKLPRAHGYILFFFSFSLIVSAHRPGHVSRLGSFDAPFTAHCSPLPTLLCSAPIVRGLVSPPPRSMYYSGTLAATVAAST